MISLRIERARGVHWALVVHNCVSGSRTVEFALTLEDAWQKLRARLR